MIYLDVNDARANKINLADNKTADDAAWDNEALVAQLNGILSEDDGALLGTAFAPDELVARVAALVDGAPSEDAGTPGRGRDPA